MNSFEISLDIFITDIIGNETNGEIAEAVIKATGPKGSNYKYVLNLAEGLRNMNIGTEKANNVYVIEKKIKKMINGMLPYKYYSIDIMY